MPYTWGALSEDLGPEIDAQHEREVHSPDHVRSLAHRRVIAILEVLLCSSLPTQLIITIALTALGMPARDGDQLSLPFVFVLSLTDTVVLIALMVMLTRAHGESVSTLWLGDRPIAREALVGIGLVPVAVLMVGLLIGSLRQIAPWLHDVETNPLETLASGGPVDAAMFAVIAIVAGGLREELQRAFLLRRFEQHLGGALVGVVVLSVAFGLGHLMQGRDAAVATGILGAFWAVVYVRRRSSVAPIVSHAGFNSIEVLRVAIGGS